MILVCDIGNTNITFGLFKGRNLLFKDNLPTLKFKQARAFLKNIFKARNASLPQIEAGAICSVVPGLNRALADSIKSIADIPIYRIGEDLKVGLKNLYSRPKQVGQDRLMAAYMAIRLYGAPVIVADLGTALTFDVVSKNKEYLGGIILPGLNISLSALYRHTALLPQIRPSRAKTLIGKDTKGSMLSGITFGFGSLIDGLAQKLKKELGAKAKVVACGGDSLFIRPYCKNIDYFEPNLILKGIAEALMEKIF